MNPAQRIELGQQIVIARELRGWSQAALAEKADVAPNTLSKIENGVGEPRPGKLRDVLDTLGLEPVAETLTREYPQDVAIVRDFVGLLLLGIPERERPAKVREMTASVIEILGRKSDAGHT